MASASLRSAVLSFALLGLVPVLGGCGPSIDEAYMAKDSSGDLKTTKFHIDGDQIYCILKFVGGDEETKLTFSLTGDGALEVEEEELFPRPTSDKQGPIDIDVQLLTKDASGEVYLDGPWPPGNYTMKIAIDDVPDTSLDFKIGP